MTDIKRFSKQSPCPHCGKHDWCYAIGKLTCCKRQQPPADGWKATSETDREGTPYYAPTEQNWQDRTEKKTRQKTDRTWIYYDLAGNPQSRTRRIDYEGRDKKIWQEFWVENNWYTPSRYQKRFSQELDSSQHRSKVALYRYQEVKDALDKGESIWVVEGEPIADRLWSWGIPATTCLGGSQGWNHRYSQMLEGASLILCPDRDQPGVKFMETIARDFPDALWLYVYPNSPLWKNLPESDGLDLLDWIEDRATKDDIKAAVVPRRQTKETAPNPQGKEKGDPIGFEASELFDKIQNAKQENLSIIDVLSYAGAPEFAAKLAQSADILNIDPFMIWAYDAPASLSLLPSNAGVEIEPAFEPSILNCAIVIESGEGKTRAAKLVLAYLRELEKKAWEQFEEEQANWKEQEAVARKEKQSFSEPPPRLEKALAEVATIQALLRRLNKKERGLLWARDELKGLFSSLGQFASNESEDKEITLAFWDGSSFSLDRVKMEDCLYVESSRVSIVGGIQPGILNKVFSDPDDSQGMAARFLFHIPKILPYKRKRDHADLTDFYPNYFDWVRNSFKCLPHLKLSEEAQSLYEEIVEKLFEQGREESNAAVAAWLKKTGGHIARLAITLHLHQCYERRKASRFIEIEIIQAAIFLIDYYAKAFLIVQAQLDSKNEAMLLEKIQQKALKTGRPLAMKDIYRNINPVRTLAKESGIGVSEYCQQLCKCLENKGLGRIQTIKGSVCYVAFKSP